MKQIVTAVDAETGEWLVAATPAEEQVRIAETIIDGRATFVLICKPTDSEPV